MAGTRAGMCGRSSSGPAAAASLHVVTSAKACTSGTWEGRPADGGAVGVRPSAANRDNTADQHSGSAHLPVDAVQCTTPTATKLDALPGSLPPQFLIARQSGQPASTVAQLANQCPPRFAPFSSSSGSAMAMAWRP